MLEHAARAITQMFSPPLRAVLWKSDRLTRNVWEGSDEFLSVSQRQEVTRQPDCARAPIGSKCSVACHASAADGGS